MHGIAQLLHYCTTQWLMVEFKCYVAYSSSKQVICNTTDFLSHLKWSKTNTDTSIADTNMILILFTLSFMPFNKSKTSKNTD